MSSAWPSAKLGTVCKVRRGSVITKKASNPGNIPVIAGGVGPAYYHDTPNRDANVITVSGSGANAGYVNFFDRPIWASDCSTIEPADPSLDVHYVHRFLLSVQKFINENLRQGAAQPHVYPKDLAQLEIPLPPLEEQKRIVAVLDHVFAALDRARALAEANLADAEELFEQVTSDIFSRISENAKETKPVSDIAVQRKGSIRTGPFGSQLKHSEFVGEGIKVLGIDNAVQNRYVSGKARFITDEKYQALKRYTVFPGDVIITIMGTCGRCAIIPEDIPLAINTKHLCCITLDEGRCLPEYLHRYFLLSSTAREYLEANAKGSVMDGLNMGIIKELPVELPELEEQRDVCRSVAALEEAMAVAKRLFQDRLDDLTDLRQSLLQKAFAGQLT